MNLEKEKLNILKNESLKLISLKKFVFYYIFTLTLYQFYWAYQSWKIIKEDKTIKLNPSLSNILTGSLANHQLETKNGFKIYYSYALLFAIAYVITLISRRVKEPFDLIYLLGFIPLLPIVQSFNNYCKNIPLTPFKGEFVDSSSTENNEDNLINQDKVKTNDFSGKDILVAIPGGILIIMYIMKSFN